MGYLQRSGDCTTVSFGHSPQGALQMLQYATAAQMSPMMYARVDAFLQYCVLCRDNAKLQFPC